MSPRQLGMTDVKRLNRDWRRRSGSRLSLLLDGVGQPFNVGSIIRSAAAFGVSEVWLCGDTAQPGHPSARKTALGTDRLLAFEQVATAAAGADGGPGSGLPGGGDRAGLRRGTAA